MKKSNVILVYDENKEKILMCKRKKNPYKGLLNLVGGKVEKGETSEHAAYRELYEESGISSKDIVLTHLMDMVYHLDDLTVEVYIGVLFHHVEVYGEENELCWVDKNENFFDMNIYAGEGNIGHMVKVAEDYHNELFDDLLFIKPDESYAAEIAAYRQEFLDANDSMDGTGNLRECEDPLKWISQSRDYEDASKVPSHWVTCEQYILVRKKDQRILGMIQLRHELSEYLLNYGGHVGYSVRPSERKKGYATLMLSKLMEVCREKNMERVLVTCLKNNEASRKTILKNGGVYEDERFEADENEYIERYWITL